MGEQTVAVGAQGFAALVVWARELGAERVWALEDCRHVSSSFERFWIERGERVLRVTTKLMALRRIRELSQAIKALEAEIARLVAQIAPQLLSEPGFGPLTAAKLVGEIAGAGRFASDAKLARRVWHLLQPRPSGLETTPTRLRT